MSSSSSAQVVIGEAAVDEGIPPSTVSEGIPVSVGALATLSLIQARRKGSLGAATKRLALALGMNDRLVEQAVLVHLDYDLYQQIATLISYPARFTLPKSGSCEMSGFGTMGSTNMIVSDEGDRATCTGGDGRAEIVVDTQKLEVALAMPKASSIHIIYLRCEGMNSVCGMMRVQEDLYDVEVHAPARSIFITARSSGRQYTKSLAATDPIAELYLGVYLFDGGATVRIE